MIVNDSIPYSPEHHEMIPGVGRVCVFQSFVSVLCNVLCYFNSFLFIYKVLELSVYIGLMSFKVTLISFACL